MDVVPHIAIFSFCDGYEVCRVMDIQWLDDLWRSAGVYAAAEDMIAEFERAISSGGPVFFVRKDGEIKRFLYWHPRKKQILLLPFVSQIGEKAEIRDIKPVIGRLEQIGGMLVDLDKISQILEYFSIVSSGAHPPPETEELQPSLQIFDDLELRRNLDLPMSWTAPLEEFLRFLND